jgi:hypothetical protein
MSETVRGRVLEYAASSLGATVGSGECVALAARALRAAGAKARRRGDSPGKGDYVWGELVLTIEASPDGPKLTGSLDDVAPGDIAQFRDAVFPKSHFSHHTAVVAGISRERLAILQQNFGGKRFVTRTAVRIDKLSAGWIRIYRPVPRAPAPDTTGRESGPGSTSHDGSRPR